MGMSPWWGLTFALNLGFISEMNISGAGIVAAAAAFGAVAMFLRDRRLGGRPAGACSCPTEVMLIAAIGSAWWLWGYQKSHRDAALALLVPIGAVGLWGLYLRLQIGLESGVCQSRKSGCLLCGFVQAIEGWTSDPLDMAVGVAIMVLFVLYTRRVLLSKHLVGWAFLGFVALGVVFTQQVWQSYFDITRAIAPR